MSRRMIIGLGLVLALAAPTAALAEEQVCPAGGCVGMGLIRGAAFFPPDIFRSFSWTLRFDGVMRRNDGSQPRNMSSTSYFYGQVTNVSTLEASGFGTMVVLDEGARRTLALPMQFKAVGSRSSDGVQSYSNGALVPITAGAGYGSSFVITDGELTGSVNGAHFRDDLNTAIVTTIIAPQTFNAGIPFVVNGHVRSAGSGLPSVPVDLIVDGNFKERVTTTDSGAWSTSLVFDDAVPHTVQAVSFRDTPFPSKSPVRTVSSLMPLTINVTGPNGTVTGPGISCTITCTFYRPYGEVVPLTASSDASTYLMGWSGACSGAGACSVTMNQARTVGADFAVKTFALTVSKLGTGTGSVTSAPAGISCGSTCSATYRYGTTVSLTAAPVSNSTFSAWTGACSGSGTCNVTMTAARSVSAIFSLKNYSLTVSKSGTGAGTIASSPAGISCGSTCSATFAHGSNVSLGFTPAVGTYFVGWSGDCIGTSTCSVTLDQARNVVANMALVTYTLSVGVNGSGNGSVSSAPAGISCPGTCSANYTHGTQVTLTPAPAADSNFTGWSGACSGTGSCVVNMDQSRNVTATFAIKTFTLTMTKSGNGIGTVTANPGNNVCSPTCSVSYPYGTQVTLGAEADWSSSFVGWTGAGCSNNGPCYVTMTQSWTVNAIFSLYNADIVESEPNDSMPSSDPVTLPVRYAGSLSAGDVDYVTFTVSSWTSLHIETFDSSMSNCGLIDTIVRLRQWDGTVLAEDDDGGVNLCSLVDAVIAPGTYYVDVRPFGSTTANAYRLWITGVPASSWYEPNNTFATAAPVVYPGELFAAIDPIGDLDYYSFTLAVAEDVEIETFDGPTASCSGIDTIVRLYDGAGTQIASDDDGGLDLCSYIYAPLSPGTYRIRVEDFGNNSVIGRYRLAFDNFVYD